MAPPAQTPSPLMRRLLGVAGLWRGTIAHEPWPLQRADVALHRCSMLEAVTGLAPVGSVVSHCSAGVDDVEFFFEAI